MEQTVISTWGKVADISLTVAVLLSILGGGMWLLWRWLMPTVQEALKKIGELTEAVKDLAASSHEAMATAAATNETMARYMDAIMGEVRDIRESVARVDERTRNVRQCARD